MYDSKMRKFNNDLSDQIIYRGEGNSSIVVALKEKAKVIRLLKKDGKIMKSSQDHCITQHPMRSIRFIHSIMKPLTSPYLSVTTELVHLKSEFINMLSKKVECERPLHRLDKTLNLDDQYALVMDDLCTLPSKLTKNLNERDFIGPTISVEIKPKQGFLLPARPTIMQSCANNDKTVAKLRGSCLYGLNQHLKLARGRIEKMSNYCPLNLFSGCPIKMKAALGALLDNPQNNLRIFKNLILAYDETDRKAMSNLFEDVQTDDESMTYRESNGYDYERSTSRNKQLLIDLLIQCLLSEPTVNDHTGRTGKEMVVTSLYGRDDENLFCSNSISDQCMWHQSTPNSIWREDMLQCPQDRKAGPSLASGDSAHKLPRSCVLACVLRAQRLDSIGPLEARSMLEWLLEDNKTNRSNIGRDSCRGNDILEELSKPRLPKGFGVQTQLPFESTRDYYFRKVWEFLVSLTAKDCSIIITIRQITHASYELLQSRSFEDNLLIDKMRGTYYVYHIGIADFDQKMPLKILRICENLNHIMFLARNQDNAPYVPLNGESLKKQPERNLDCLDLGGIK